VAGAAKEPAPKSASIWKDSYLLKFLVIMIFYLTCFILMFRLVPVYWKVNLHMGEAVVGLLLGLNGVVITLFEMVLVRYWESKNKSMFYIVSGMLVTAGGYICLTMNGLPPVLIGVASVLFLTFGEMLALPFISSAVMQRANESNRGKYAAAFAVSFAIANIIGPAGGALIAEYGGYFVLWIILAALCLLCALAFNSIKDKDH
jgi:predicted MFS family arabinose efflux permease